MSTFAGPCSDEKNEVELKIFEDPKIKYAERLWERSMAFIPAG